MGGGRRCIMMNMWVNVANPAPPAQLPGHPPLAPPAARPTPSCTTTVASFVASFIAPPCCPLLPIPPKISLSFYLLPTCPCKPSLLSPCCPQVERLASGLSHEPGVLVAKFRVGPPSSTTVAGGVPIQDHAMFAARTLEVRRVLQLPFQATP